ncbi:hypothetical protein Hanom_Chr06g00492571 [Helianthus anomalus]
MSTNSNNEQLKGEFEIDDNNEQLGFLVVYLGFDGFKGRIFRHTSVVPLPHHDSQISSYFNSDALFRFRIVLKSDVSLRSIVS